MRTRPVRISPVRIGAGAGGLGLTALAAVRLSAAGLPGAAWIALGVAGAGATAVSALSLVLDYRLRKLALLATSRDHDAVASLHRDRLAGHQQLLDQATAQPQAAGAYCELINADALYLAVERGGAFPAEHVYRARAPAAAETGVPAGKLSPPAAPARTPGSGGTSSPGTRHRAGTPPRPAPTTARAHRRSPHGPS